jgi:hypothetical protein
LSPIFLPLFRQARQHDRDRLLTLPQRRHRTYAGGAAFGPKQMFLNLQVSDPCL